MNPQITFFAMLFRMRHISRWGLMYNTQRESLSQHSLECAFLAHFLALIGNAEFGGNYNPERLCACALYHDASEIITGDLPTPVKYYNAEIRETYQKIERSAAEKLAGLLPESIRGMYAPYLSGEGLTGDEKALLKAADKLCAYIKCVYENSAGNTEFSGAYAAIGESLEQTRIPAVRYFMEHCIDAFSLPLDELGGEL